MNGRKWIEKIEVNPAFVLLFIAFYLADMLEIYFLSLLCAAWHEAGHLFAMHCLGEKGAHLRIQPFGIRIATENPRYGSYGGDIFIALAGPLFNLAAAAFFYVFVGDVGYLTGINLTLFAFNLLPAGTLDGGRALFGLLALLLPYERAYRAWRVVSWAAAAITILVGAGVFYLSGYNISLLVAGIALAVSLI